MLCQATIYDGEIKLYKNPATPCICCYTTLWNINVGKQAINDKLQGSVATYFKCVGVVIWIFIHRKFGSDTETIQHKHKYKQNTKYNDQVHHIIIFQQT